MGSCSELGLKCTINVVLAQRNMSQTKLSELMDVSPQHVNNWVKGRAIPRMDKQLRLSEILKCTINDFYRWDDEDGL